MRHTVLFSIALVITGAAVAYSRPSINEHLPPSYSPSGKVLYEQYCATCHGVDAKGLGPMAAILKIPPPDLTTLVKRHVGQPPYDGKFPYNYVRGILEFGPGPSAHGSPDMPAWGPIFRYMDRQNERAVQQRIRNLCNYLASLQEM